MASRAEAFLDALTGGGYEAAKRGGPPPKTYPVGYGPGRGLLLAQRPEKARELLAGDGDGAWVLTRGPTQLGRSARQADGKERPTLHCSALTNLSAGFLTGRTPQGAEGGGYTHAGNIPPIWDLIETSGGEHNGVAFVGYGGPRGAFARCHPHGQIPRIPGLPLRDADGRSCLHGMDLLTVLRRCHLEPPAFVPFAARKGEAAPPSGGSRAEARRPDEPSIFFFAQSSRRPAGGWRWWHHTGLFVLSGGADGPVVRIAADGSRNGQGLYSGTPVDAERLVTPPQGKAYLVWQLCPSALHPSPLPLVAEV
jgi:hypothetical protein